MTLSLRFAALSDVGRVRRDNQDSGYVGPHLLVIADGVGGAARGDIASSATIDALRKLDTPPGNDALSELSATLHLAHDRLSEIVESHPDLDGTSTTVSAAIFDGTHLRIGHVGDSRAYLLRGGALQQLTNDHTLVQSLVDEGRITEDEARVHPHRNLILRAVDGVHEPEPDLFSVPLGAGDRLLFCSDGCSGVLDPPTMAAMLAGDPLEAVCAELVRSSLEAGSSDNVTVVVAEVVEGDVPLVAAPLVVGAAASTPHLLLADESTGNLSDSDVEVLSTAIDPEELRYAPLPPPRGRWLGRILALLILVGVIGGGGYAAYRYSQTRFYVSNENGVVTINRGVDVDIPLVDLNRVESVSAFTVADMDANADGVFSSDYSSVTEAEAAIRRAACTEVPAGEIVIAAKNDASLTDRLLAPILPKVARPTYSKSGASCGTGSP